MATFIKLLPIFGASIPSVTLLSSYISGADTQITKTIKDSSGKEWVKLGNHKGDGIFVKSKGIYKIVGGGHNKPNFYTPARIGTQSQDKINILPEDTTVLIVSGREGAAIFTGKRHFENVSSDKKAEKVKEIRGAGGVNSEVWNTGTSTKIKDEEPDFYCQGWTDFWKKVWNYKREEGQVTGFIKHPQSKGEYGIISLIDTTDSKKAKLIGDDLKTVTNCRGIQIFYPNQLTLFSRQGKRIDTNLKTSRDKRIIGHSFNLGEIESVLYTKNKDLRITDRGLEDTLGNIIKYGQFISKLEFE